MKTRIQTESSSGHFKRLVVQSRKSKSIWSPKYFEMLPSQPRSFENFRGDSVGCL